MPFKHVAVFGASIDPPGRHHIEIVREVADKYGGVIVVPCGPRPDKDNVGRIEPIHRAVMADLAFGKIPGVTVDLFDLEQDRFTRTWDLQKRYERDIIPHLVVGSDLVKGGRNGRSKIQTKWFNGEKIWRELNWIVFQRKGHLISERDLPPNAVLHEPGRRGSSTEIRETIYRGQSADGMVTPEIASYIRRHGLYRGAASIAAKHLVIEEPRPLIVTAEHIRLGQYGYRPERFSTKDPNCVLVFGGDGTMLHAVREFWRTRLPFIGVNMGTKGFLMNEAPDFDRLEEWVGELLAKRLSVIHSPLLYVETDQGKAVAFNDAWVERATGQTARLRVSVNGVERLNHMIADGILAATPSGSTAYASGMGAHALPMNANALILIGSNVMHPKWTWANLDADSRIDIEALDTEKRPVRGYADGVDLGIVNRMSIRSSRIAAAEIAFDPEYDMTAKRAAHQFPEVAKEV